MKATADTKYINNSGRFIMRIFDIQICIGKHNLVWHILLIIRHQWQFELSEQTSHFQHFTIYDKCQNTHFPIKYFICFIHVLILINTLSSSDDQNIFRRFCFCPKAHQSCLKGLNCTCEMCSFQCIISRQIGYMYWYPHWYQL